jgi:large subunit ribosomal protein L21e
LVAEPAVQNGNFNPRFHGSVGTITGKQGECYNVAIKDGNKAKNVIVHPIHLIRCLK